MLGPTYRLPTMLFYPKHFNKYKSILAGLLATSIYMPSHYYYNSGDDYVNFHEDYSCGYSSEIKSDSLLV